MDGAKRNLLKHLCWALALVFIGTLAVVLIVYLAHRRFLPNPISFGGILYATPLLILFGIVMMLAAFADYLTASGKKAGLFVRAVDKLTA